MHNKKRLVPALLAALLVVAMPVAALQEAEQAKIVALMQAGQAEAASKALDEALAKTPDDFQLRYLKALSMMDRNLFAEAAAHLDKMIASFPGVAALHNNRGVARTRLSQYTAAAQDFEEALRLEPTYAMASENLGMVYANLADLAMSSALKLDPGNARLAQRHSLLRAVVTGESPAPVPTPAAKGEAPAIKETVAKPPLASSVVASAAPVEAPPVMQALPSVAPELAVAAGVAAAAIAPAAAQALEQPPAVTDATPPSLPVKEPAQKTPEKAPEISLPAVEASAQTTAAPAAQVPMADSGDTAQAEAVLKVLESWRTAWVAKDMKTYMATYSPTFKPRASYKDVAEWRADREKNIAGRKLPIEIKVENPVVLFTPEGLADVRFDQHYRSGPVIESNRKYFLMSSQGGRWFIEAEKMLTDPLVGGPGVATATPPKSKPAVAPVVEKTTPPAAKPAAKPVEKSAEKAVAPSLAPAPKGEEAAVMATMEAWRKAWTAKDMPAYFATYSPTFKPRTGLKDIAEWKQDREANIAGRKLPTGITLENPSLHFNEEGFAELEVVQVFKSLSVTDRSRKIFVLSKQGDRWLIESETRLKSAD